MFCPTCGAALDNAATFCSGCGSRLGVAAPSAMAAMPAPGYIAAAPRMDYATWGTRAVGYLIDALLVGAAMAAIYLVLGTMLTSMARVGGESLASGTCCIVLGLFPIASLVVGIYNRVYLVSLRGSSIGQGIVHVKVVDASGNLLSQGTAAIRLLAQVGMGFVPFLPLLDLLWPLWDERRQTLHDKAVGCYVINQPH